MQRDADTFLSNNEKEFIIQVPGAREGKAAVLRHSEAEWEHSWAANSTAAQAVQGWSWCQAAQAPHGEAARPLAVFFQHGLGVARPTPEG